MIVRLQLNVKNSKESQTRLMSWYWKRKPTWREDLITCNSHPWIMFFFNWLVIIWRGCSFDIGRRRSRRWKNFGRGWTMGVGGGSWKLDYFHGRHVCIIPRLTFSTSSVHFFSINPFLCLFYYIRKIIYSFIFFA